MAVAITAVEQDVWPPRVLVSVTGLTLGDAIEVYRVVGGERTLVRAGADPDVADTAFIRVDAELPFGLPVSYVAVVNAADADTVGPTTYALPGGKVALSDAISGLAAEVVILSWPALQFRRQSTRFKVGGRNVGVGGSFGQAESALELYLETTSGSDQVEALLRNSTQATVQIRQPGGYAGVDGYLFVDDADERRFSQDGTDERRIWALQVAEVESWAPALEARGYTLGDIADAYDGLTLQDLSDDFGTLLDIAQGDFS